MGSRATEREYRESSAEVPSTEAEVVTDCGENDIGDVAGAALGIAADPALTQTKRHDPMKRSTGAAVRDHRNAVRDRSESLSAFNRIAVRNRRNPHSSLRLISGEGITMGDSTKSRLVILQGNRHEIPRSLQSRILARAQSAYRLSAFRIVHGRLGFKPLTSAAASANSQAVTCPGLRSGHRVDRGGSCQYTRGDVAGAPYEVL